MASAFLFLLNRIMDEINFSTSSRPSWLTDDVEIIDGSRCHFSSRILRNSSMFVSTVGIPGLFRSHFVCTMVNGTLWVMSQSAYSKSFSIGGMDASINRSTPARLDRVVKYSFVNLSHISVDSFDALAKPYPGRSTIHHFFATR